jgi:endonuclease-8
VPEGPEIRRAADEVAGAIENRKVASVFFAFDALKPFEDQLRGRTVRAVETRGKAMLVRFTGGLSIYSHNQLYGRWYVRARGDLPRTGRQLRLAIHTARSSALLYSASAIEVLDEKGVAGHPFLSRLGPDILDPGLRPARVARRFLQQRFRRRQVAGLLLDQSFLCGTGNYLRSEILFVAGVGPDARPQDLEPERLRALGKAVCQIGRRAYRTGGVTNDPATVRRLKAAKEPRSRYRFFVFGRDGQPCHRCGGIIVRADAAGRRIYHCPVCQVAAGD